MPADWKSAWSSFAMAMLFFAVLAWAAYFWERSTGLTWASRYRIGRISTPAHLEKTRNFAIGATLLGTSVAAVFYLTRRR